jgi:preprotein translocase subunit SecG
MMILTWLLTLVLVVDCLVLMLLVLIQLPKKEAGMGQAFGGSATDALFGPGSGTALTKLTKYASGIFFVLTLILAMMHLRVGRSSSGDLRKALTTDEKQSLVPQPKTAPPTNAAAAASTGTDTNAPKVPTNQLKLNLPTNNANATPVEKAK